MALKDTVCRNIKAMRLEKGLTQQQLADKAGVNVRYISKLENSSQNLSLDLLETLGKVLKCSPQQFLGDAKSVSVRRSALDDFNKALSQLEVFRAKLKVDD